MGNNLSRGEASPYKRRADAPYNNADTSVCAGALLIIRMDENKREIVGEEGREEGGDARLDRETQVAKGAQGEEERSSGRTHTRARDRRALYPV